MHACNINILLHAASGWYVLFFILLGNNYCLFILIMELQLLSMLSRALQRKKTNNILILVCSLSCSLLYIFIILSHGFFYFIILKLCVLPSYHFIKHTARSCVDKETASSFVHILDQSSFFGRQFKKKTIMEMSAMSLLSRASHNF